MVTRVGLGASPTRHETSSQCSIIAKVTDGNALNGSQKIRDSVLGSYSNGANVIQSLKLGVVLEKRILLW